jgi:hypothetical protein
MSAFCFDTSAILTLRDDELGAAGVSDACGAVCASLVESQPVSERQIKLCHHCCLQAANRAADALVWNREELVDHQLGSFA